MHMSKNIWLEGRKFLILHKEVDLFNGWHTYVHIFYPNFPLKYN